AREPRVEPAADVDVSHGRQRRLRYGARVVGHPAEVAVVEYDHGTIGAQPDVEFDRIRAGVDGRLERREGVLRSHQGGTAVRGDGHLAAQVHAAHRHAGL